MSGKTVLIVEDQYDNRAIYSEILRYGGYVVLEAANGRDGVALARKHRPDLILMDLSMPVMNGWDALAQLRADPCTCDIPVLAVSAHVLVAGAYREAREAGFVGYLTKPVEPKTVLEEVAARIGKGDSPRGARRPPPDEQAGAG